MQQSKRGTNYEPLLNQELAHLLRQHGIEAEAERVLTDVGGNLHRVDILVEFEEHRAAIEAEFAQARTVRDDARKRMPETPLVWCQLPVRHVFEVVCPAYLRDVPESEAPSELAQCNSLEFTLVPRSTDDRVPFGDLVGPRQEAAETRFTGPVGAFADCLQTYWVQTADGASVDETVRTVARAIDYASELLGGRVPVPETVEDSDPAATNALIWLNALVPRAALGPS